MPLKPPIKTPVVDQAGKSTNVWSKFFGSIPYAGELNSEAYIWAASGSGTKDAQAYDEGDILVTSVVGGVSKTVLLVDWSAV